MITYLKDIEEEWYLDIFWCIALNNILGQLHENAANWGKSCLWAEILNKINQPHPDGKGPSENVDKQGVGRRLRRPWQYVTMRKTTLSSPWRSGDFTYLSTSSLLQSCHTSTISSFNKIYAVVLLFFGGSKCSYRISSIKTHGVYFGKRILMCGIYARASLPARYPASIVFHFHVRLESKSDIYM